jgi:hypothetical protein
MPHFENSFNPSTDVIYGTGLWIHIYLYNYYFRWPYGYPEIRKDDLRLSVKFPKGEYESQMAAAHDKYGLNVINLYNEPITPKSFNVSNDKKVGKPNFGQVNQKDKTTEKLAQDYFDSLVSCKHYGPESVEGQITERLIRSLKKYQDSSSLNFSQNLSGKGSKKIAFDLYDVCIRRSCKFGIYYFTGIKSAKLHYILDEMDIGAIVNKSTMKNETTQKSKVPICTSEVRYIFRHWNSLRNGSVYFYLDFQLCPSPWEHDKWKQHFPDWARYAESRVQKYRKQILAGMNNLAILNRFDECSDAFNQSPNAMNAKKVINAFHDLPVNLVNSPSDDTAKI